MTQSKLVLCLAISGVAACAAHSVRAAPRADHRSDRKGLATTECVYNDWTRIRGPVRDSEPWILRNPSIQVRNGEGYLAGNDIVQFGIDRKIRHRIVLATLQGHVISPPPGPFLFAYPQLVSSTEGDLHLFWGETGFAPSKHSWDGLPRVVSIWHASYRRSDGWSAPEEVVHQPGMVWRPAEADVLLDARGRLHLAVANGPAGGDIIHVLGDSTGWHTSLLPGIVAGNATLAVTPSGSLYLSYIDLESREPHAVPAIFIRRSEDGGRMWSEPTLIARTGRTQATAVRLLASTGTLRVVWGESRKNEVVPDVVRQMISYDHGHSWTEARPLVVPGGFMAIEAVMDRCETTHVVLDPWPGSVQQRSSVLYARWAGAWSAITSPFRDVGSLSPALTVDPAGALYLEAAAWPDSARAAPTALVPAIAVLPYRVSRR